MTSKPTTIFTEFDVSLFQNGTHYRLYEKMGAHPAIVDGVPGVRFAVYAPAAAKVSVIGDFNNWKEGKDPLYPHWDSSGIWEGFIPFIGKGTMYKYAIEAHSGWKGVKSDPYGRLHQKPPDTASIVWFDKYTWEDEKWMSDRNAKNKIDVPMSVYEIHLASWKKKGDGSLYSFRELAEILPAYINDMGFTHIEFMPVMEHPYDPSWGYQITGFFATSARWGKPEDFKYLVDVLHQNGIGVILDWVPSHFPTDGHGPGYFDGSHLYEHPDTRRGYHPDWQSLIFNYGRPEIKSFLISNALFWLDKFHVDGLRVDAVASMLYLDYSRKEGEWEPNIHGGKENLEAIDFLKAMNETVYSYYPDIITIAEESTSFKGVSHPTYNGGLGFGMKWMMGWMHDTLNYFKLDPYFRKDNHNQITFSMIYAYAENFVLPLSHDEVVHGKGSLLSRMPGEGKEQFANLRLLLGYMFAHPGAKLLFMGGEFGQRSEWNFKSQLEWDVLNYESHAGIQNWVKTLNKMYREKVALNDACTKPEGFNWVVVDDATHSVLAFERISASKQEKVLCIFNLTPVARDVYRIGTTEAGSWELLHHSDEEQYWGNNTSPHKNVSVIKKVWNNHSMYMDFYLPGLTALFYKWHPAPGNTKTKGKAVKKTGLQERRKN